MDCRNSVRTEPVYLFGRFRFYPNRQLLMCEDRPVKLGARTFELLSLMVQRSGELVSKDELIAAAWPNIFVHDSNLKVNMCSLRRLLGDTQKEPSFIATESGRGYRFVSTVQIRISDVHRGGVKTDERRGLPPQFDVVGRSNEIADTLAHLRREHHITVVGAGGVGKTTVAIAAAHAFVATCPYGVCFVDLSTCSEPTLVPAAIASALGIRSDVSDPLSVTIEYLQQRRMLVVLDSCEHVLPGASIFARKLASHSGLSRLLTTSREPLGTSSEHIVRVHPLAYPDAGDVLTLKTANRYSAFDLFARRASEWAGYHLVDTDCAIVAQICRSLDGLPLAIELAAAKLKSQTVQEVLAIVDDQLNFQNRNGAERPARQETLQNTIDWSFNLLSHNEATILSLVSVFSNAFELEDVVTIAATVGLDPADVTTGLGGLVAKSLMTAQMNGSGINYKLLECTRRYAATIRQKDPINEPVLRSFAYRILSLLEQSEREWNWRKTDDWSCRYKSRVADLRATLSWAFGEDGETALGIRLTAAAIPLWSELSLISEAQAQVGLALKMAKTIQCDDLLKAQLHEDQQTMRAFRATAGLSMSA